MADQKISDLAAAGALTGTELVEAVQGGVNVQTTTQDIADLAGGGGHVIEEEGTPLTQRTKLNFVGAGVTVTDDSGDDASVVTIPSQVSDVAYDATSWNGVTSEAPSKNAIRDYIEANTLAYTPANELTEIAGLTLETDITTAQLLEALAISTIIPIHADAVTQVTITNMASAAAVFPLNGTTHYCKFSTVNARQMRLYARVSTTSASANNPRMYIQYSITAGASFVTLGAGTIVSGDAISLFTGATAVQVTNWITVPAEAKGESFIWRVMTEGGDGAADPVVGNVFIEYRT